MPMSALSSGSVSHFSRVLWLLISSLKFIIMSMALWDGGSLSMVVLRHAQVIAVCLCVVLCEVLM